MPVFAWAWVDFGQFRDVVLLRIGGLVHQEVFAIILRFEFDLAAVLGHKVVIHNLGNPAEEFRALFKHMLLFKGLQDCRLKKILRIVLVPAQAAGESVKFIHFVDKFCMCK